MKATVQQPEANEGGREEERRFERAIGKADRLHG